MNPFEGLGTDEEDLDISELGLRSCCCEELLAGIPDDLGIWFGNSGF